MDWSTRISTVNNCSKVHTTITLDFETGNEILLMMLVILILVLAALAALLTV